MDSKKAYEQMQDEMIDRESAYLCTEVERAVSYTHLTLPTIMPV